MPQDIRSMIPEDDSSLWIKDGLSKIDLSSVRKLFRDCGGIAYDPLPMLGILLLAYTEGETGSRTIEKRCRRDIGYMYVGDGLKPDDRTIRRFRRRIDPVLDEVFRSVVTACKKAGLLTMRRVAADGTRIASACSQLNRWMTASEKQDVEEMGLTAPECSDPDARNLGKSGTFVRGYNGQAAVDCDSGVVVAVSLDNVSSDGHHLAPLVKKVVANAGESPVELVADAGYDTHEGACACEELGVKAIIAAKDASMKFWSVTDEDKIVCPMGNEAVPGGKSCHNQQGSKTYVALRVVGCSKCSYFKECCGHMSARSLSFPEGTNPIHRINVTYRSRSPEGKAAMRERFSSIEPVFADIKANKRMGRFKLRGLAGARIEWTLMHMARNLVKLGKTLRGAAPELIRRLFAILLQLSAIAGQQLRFATQRSIRFA